MSTETAMDILDILSPPFVCEAPTIRAFPASPGPTIGTERTAMDGGRSRQSGGEKRIRASQRRRRESVPGRRKSDAGRSRKEVGCIAAHNLWFLLINTYSCIIEIRLDTLG